MDPKSGRLSVEAEAPPIRVSRAAQWRVRIVDWGYTAATHIPWIRRVLPERLKSWARTAFVGRSLDDALHDDTTLVRFSVNGVNLTAPSHFVALYIGRQYEPLLVRWLQRHLSPGAVAVDVGAHIEFLSIIMSRAVGPAGHIVALEPAPENVRLLRRNLSANGSSNVQVVPSAAGDAAGKHAFHLTGSTDSHGFYDHPLTPTMSTIEVDVARLDDLLTGTVDLVKIDVEGAELDVLSGMDRIFREGLKYLVVEWNPACQLRAGRKVAELPERLTREGYSLTVLDDLRHRKAHGRGSSRTACEGRPRAVVVFEHCRPPSIADSRMTHSVRPQAHRTG